MATGGSACLSESCFAITPWSAEDGEGMYGIHLLNMHRPYTPKHQAVFILCLFRQRMVLMVNLISANKYCSESHASCCMMDTQA